MIDQSRSIPRIRVVVAKPGLDGHDRGAKGHRAGAARRGHGGHLHGVASDPEQIVETVLQEDADAVGLSILSGAHMTLVPLIVDLIESHVAARRAPAASCEPDIDSQKR
jgi:methylmalonyl-CoA mutase C-terminal domain/subunit